jgi:2-dehydropantoate 2-reductase
MLKILVVGGIDEALTQGPFDAAVLAVKSFDTRPLLESLMPYLVALPPVFACKMGLRMSHSGGNAGQADRVIAGSVTSAIGRRGPGDVMLERLRGLAYHRTHELSPVLHSVFNAAGLNARLYDQPFRHEVVKNADQPAGKCQFGDIRYAASRIFAHSGLYNMEMRQVRECLRVMAVQRIPVVDLAGHACASAGLVCAQLATSCQPAAAAAVVG